MSLTGRERLSARALRLETDVGTGLAYTRNVHIHPLQTLEHLRMISPDTLAAALRVDQFAARRAMPAALRPNIADEAQARAQTNRALAPSANAQSATASRLLQDTTVSATRSG